MKLEGEGPVWFELMMNEEEDDKHDSMHVNWRRLPLKS